VIKFLKGLKNEIKNYSESFNSLVQLFSYDKDLPFNFQENTVKYKNNIIIRDISFIGLKEKVNAYLVDSGDTSEAGVIFVYPAPGNRSAFLKDAIELAGKNVVSILIESPWSNPQKFIKIAMEGVEQPEKY